MNFLAPPILLFYFPPLLLFFYFNFFLVFLGPMACRSSQGRGQIRLAAAGLHHSRSNTKSEPCL